MPARSIKTWNGLVLTYEGRKIVYARFKLGSPQKWFIVPEEHYGSKQECLAYKEGLSAERRRRKRATHEDNLKKLGETLG